MTESQYSLILTNRLQPHTVVVLAGQRTSDTGALQHVHSHDNERQGQQFINAGDGGPLVGCEGRHAVRDVLDDLDGALAIAPLASSHHNDANDAGQEGTQGLEEHHLGPPAGTPHIAVKVKNYPSHKMELNRTQTR